ncbi:hypothetical protein ACFCY8_11195 [Streptomyces noursei]
MCVASGRPRSAVARREAGGLLVYDGRDAVASVIASAVRELL